MADAYIFLILVLAGILFVGVVANLTRFRGDESPRRSLARKAAALLYYVWRQRREFLGRDSRESGQD